MRGRNSRTRYLGPEPLPHRAQLEPDVAGADDDQVVGNPRERERPGRIDDRFSVERKKRQLDRFGAGRQQDVAGS